MTAAEYAAGLREFADWIEANSAVIERDVRREDQRFLICRIEREGWLDDPALATDEAVLS